MTSHHTTSGPHSCTRGWIETVPFSGDMLHTLTTTRFEGFRGRCDGGWVGPTRNYETEAQRDVYAHNGAVPVLPSQTRQPFLPKKGWALLAAVALTISAITIGTFTRSYGLDDSAKASGPQWGDPCSPSRESYYRAHSLTCYRDTDGTYNLIANTP